MLANIHLSGELNKRLPSIVNSPLSIPLLMNENEQQW
jgi:hypothetical protein